MWTHADMGLETLNLRVDGSIPSRLAMLDRITRHYATFQDKSDVRACLCDQKVKVQNPMGLLRAGTVIGSSIPAS